MKGKFITFEGGDGAGKTTLIESVHAALLSKGQKVLKTREPGGSPVGAGIRELLLHSKNPLTKRCELFLFLADRAEHVDKVIVPALEKGEIVLCDRFNDSTIAYQAGARGIDEQQVRALCTIACNGVEPHLTLYLDLDPRVAFERVQKMGKAKDQIEAEDLTFHDKIRAAFHQIAKREPRRFFIIDASQKPESVLMQALKLIEGSTK
ncbi:MAG TPA: dTMP kinase [Rhabdochlamydiaceae bacterium]|nr:dTMP kinase [Rhabdochlamydiaceae bacterium]